MNSCMQHKGYLQPKFLSAYLILYSASAYKHPKEQKHDHILNEMLLPVLVIKSVW